ncbi:MAG TPA: YciI family protein [Alphaproteobacteria bacterium]
MAQFLVLAYDGTDADAPARRRRVRGLHFEGIKPMVERGELRAAGAILDDAGTMIGSAIFADFPSRTALDAWLAREPYVKEGVWQRIEVKPFRLAVLDGKITQ